MPRRPERVPHVAVGGLGPDQEPGPVRGLAVDPVEVVEALGPGVDDPHAARPRLVHVLAPLLAQVAPQRRLVRREVDHACRDRLDRRRGRPTGGRERRGDRATLVGAGAPLDLRVDAQVAHAPGPRRAGRQARPGQRREPRDAVRVPSLEHGAAWRIGERPGQRAGPAQQHLGPGRRIGAVAVVEAARRPAVDRLHGGPARELQVRPERIGLDERVPGGGRGVGPPGHERPRRRRRSTTTPTIRRGSSIRNASDPARMTSPPAAVATTICTSRRRNPGSDPNAVPKPRSTAHATTPPTTATTSVRSHHARHVPERERREPALEQQRQGERLEPGRGRDRDREAVEPERPDQHAGDHDVHPDGDQGGEDRASPCPGARRRRGRGRRSASGR